jgi:hypothetical protein
MNNTQGQLAARTVIEQVRDLMPRRPLSINEAYSVAERQAYTLLDLLDIRAPHVTYDKLLALPAIEITLHAPADYYSVQLGFGNRIEVLEPDWRVACGKGPLDGGPPRVVLLLRRAHRRVHGQARRRASSLLPARILDATTGANTVHTRCLLTTYVYLSQ